METLNKQYLQYEDIIENIKGRRFKVISLLMLRRSMVIAKTQR